VCVCVCVFGCSHISTLLVDDNDDDAVVLVFVTICTSLRSRVFRDQRSRSNVFFPVCCAESHRCCVEFTVYG
jgi:hypothetical protein